MPRSTHYTPPRARVLVCALYHEAKLRQIPMTRLANEIVESAVKQLPGWAIAQQQMQLAEGPKPYNETAT